VEYLTFTGLSACVRWLFLIFSANLTKTIRLSNEAYYYCTMVIQRLEEPPIQLFAVRESDIDIFESLDDLDRFLSPKPPANASQEVSSLNCGDLPLVSSHHFSKFPSSSSSFCSPNSSNSSLSLNSSVLCFKSFNFGDEPSVSFSDQSHSSRGTGRRRGSGSRRPSHRRRLTKQRHVEFNPRIKVRSIPHVQDTSEDELTTRWYRQDELADIKQEASETLRRVKAKEVPKDGEELRGLHMPKKQHRRSLWVMALTCVLDEQNRQDRDKVHDPETMAKLYQSFAFSSEQIAQVLGRQDAEAAREIYS
jgi:hypothetical protein